MSCLFNCLDAALTITVRSSSLVYPANQNVQAALNSKSPWLTPFGRESEADAVKRSFKIENSDFLTLYNAFGSWREACHNGYEREFVRVRTASLDDCAVLILERRRASSVPRTSR